VRTSYINRYPNAAYNGKPEWQYVSFGPAANYSTSNVRTAINNWFTGKAGTGADNLPANARLRKYTMQHNALTVMGTCCNPNLSLTDGLSRPTAYQVGDGNDIAFALSYCESANYLSETYFMRELYIANQPSSPVAVANYAKMNIPAVHFYGMWLRNPGDIANTMGFLTGKFTTNPDTGKLTGRVFQEYVTYNDAKGLMYPALWVNSAVFTTGHTVTGKVEPLPGDPLGIGQSFLDQHAVTVELRPTFLTPAAPELSVKAVPLNIDDLGSFTITNVPNGTYILVIKRAGYLTRAMKVTVSDTSPDIIELKSPDPAEKGVFVLWCGDCNDDLVVNTKDLMAITELWDLNITVFDANYDPACDLNSDGVIDIKDLMAAMDMISKSVWDYPGVDDVDFFE